LKAFRSLYGYNYVQNGWMGDIYYINYEKSHFLKSKISPSQPGVGRTDYNAWISAGDDGNVITGWCSCPAGNARSCSHISAIIYAVYLAWTHGVGGATCTDKPVAWGKGAAQSLTHDKLSDINFSRPKPHTAPVVTKTKTDETAVNMPQIPHELDHESLKVYVGNSSVSALWNCKGTMLYNILHAPPKIVQETVALMHGQHDLTYMYENPVENLVCSPCNEFYNEFVKLSHSNILKVEEATTTQNSTLWMDVRKIRITASKLHSVPKTDRANPNNFVNNQLYSRFKGCAATRHGQKFEHVARQYFEQETGMKCKLSGVVISKDEPFLAASPDGIINDKTILEIKCPTKPIQELLSSGKYDVVITNGEPELSPKGANGYYYQVQLGMFCTKTDLCKFLVWTPVQSIVVDVKYNKEFVNAILPRVRRFYFNHLLVRIVDECHFKRLNLCDEYKILIKNQI